MSNFLRVVKMISVYKGLTALVILFDVLSVIFSLFSLTMVVPLLGVLFGIQPIVLEKPAFSFDPNGIIDRFYYEISKVIVDDAGLVTLDGQMKALVLICGFVVLTFLLKNLFRYLALFFSAPLKNAVVRDIRNQLFRKVLSLPLAYFSEEKKGEIIAKMTSDVQEIENSVMSSVEVVFKEPFTIVFFLGTLLVWSPELTGFVLILLPLTGLVIGRVGKSLKKSSKKVQDQMGVLLSSMIEALSGLRIIKAFNATETSYGNFKQQNQSFMRMKVSMIRKQHLASPLSEVLGTFVMVAVIYYGGSLVLGGGNLKADLFIGYIVIFSQLIQPVVDRSAAYMGRYIAKNVVAAGLASKCEVQLAYAIGVAEPVSVLVDTFGTSKIPDAEIVKRVKANFKLTPRGIIETLGLLEKGRKYSDTASYGHFGRTGETFTWEKTDKAEALKG
jgi:subfamily B ATP-binding cassette protein MsbA